MVKLYTNVFPGLKGRFPHHIASVPANGLLSSLITTWVKIPNGMRYKGVTQRCLIEILLPGQEKIYNCIGV